MLTANASSAFLRQRELDIWMRTNNPPPPSLFFFLPVFFSFFEVKTDAVNQHSYVTYKFWEWVLACIGLCNSFLEGHCDSLKVDSKTIWMRSKSFRHWSYSYLKVRCCTSICEQSCIPRRTFMRYILVSSGLTQTILSPWAEFGSMKSQHWLRLSSPLKIPTFLWQCIHLKSN